LGELYFQKRPLILASGSSRRHQILSQIGIKFEVIASRIQERLPDENDDPPLLTERIASEKVKSVLLSGEKRPVLGADTVVYLEKKILGKPNDTIHACDILRFLSGKIHKVVTGIALYEPVKRKMITGHEITEVEFKSLGEDLIKWYVSTGEALDKAGAYGIQGYGSVLVKKINGCYFNVVGLPVSLLLELLKRL
jgi:septum formation protein